MTDKEFLTATPAQLARITGFHITSWSSWLRGKRRMTSTCLLTSSKWLKLEPLMLDKLIKKRVKISEKLKNAE